MMLSTRDAIHPADRLQHGALILDAFGEMLLVELGWVGPVFEVSAATGAGTEELGQAVMQHLELVDEEAEAIEEYDPAAS